MNQYRFIENSNGQPMIPARLAYAYFYVDNVWSGVTAQMWDAASNSWKKVSGADNASTPNEVLQALDLYVMDDTHPAAWVVTQADLDPGNAEYASQPRVSINEGEASPMLMVAALAIGAFLFFKK